MHKQARSEKSPDPKEKIRSDISRYENQKKLRKLYGVGRLGSMGVAAVGSFKKDPKLIIGGVGGSFLTGFMRSSAAKEESAALGRIKRHYDLRDSGKLINLNAVIPQTEKTAIVSSIADAAIALINLGAHLHTFVHSFGNAATVGLDMLTVSACPADRQGTPKHRFDRGEEVSKTSHHRRSEYALGRSRYGQRLLGSQPRFAGQASRQSHGSRAQHVHARVLRGRQRSSQNPLGKYLTNLPAGILSTMSTGKKGGELAGELLTQNQKDLAQVS